ncbi:zinc finger MYM-type 1-like [Paramuricea clavata]|uniref:Zinc finger MYM-type 1-like n=1 Tax=Paramuricea clavata TaxID=317549 RepID=A0A6S7IVY4_PARCT|nr:zinc finger MYM-type 1-like [Paramuricea clavata]
MELSLMRLLTWQIRNRGQSYDGAANVSGHFNGLRTNILQEEPRATYVHCRAHKLNLAVQNAMKNNKVMRNILNMIQDLIAFIRGSSKRMAWFSEFNESDGFSGGKSLRPFCPTRWTMRLV